MDETATELGRVIRQAREAKGLSTRAVADLVGINQSNYVRLENGAVALPNPAVLTELEHILDTDAADLYALVGYTRPSELPAFAPYLRSKFAGLPVAARAEIEQSFQRITDKYGYHAAGPLPGEDEQD